MAGRYGDLDYPALTKRTVALGLGLLAVGAAGEIAVHRFGVQLPGWEEALLLDAEIVGVLLVLLGPLIFGVLLPLTE